MAAELLSMVTLDLSRYIVTSSLFFNKTEQFTKRNQGKLT